MLSCVAIPERTQRRTTRQQRKWTEDAQGANEGFYLVVTKRGRTHIVASPRGGEGPRELLCGADTQNLVHSPDAPKTATCSQCRGKYVLMRRKQVHDRTQQSKPQRQASKKHRQSRDELATAGRCIICGKTFRGGSNRKTVGKRTTASGARYYKHIVCPGLRVTSVVSSGYETNRRRH
jgi:hypothetical protein